jgi:hypothetical protein
VLVIFRNFRVKIQGDSAYWLKINLKEASDAIRQQFEKANSYSFKTGAIRE